MCLFIYNIISGYFHFCFDESLNDNRETNSRILPRQTSTLTDYGHPNRFRGWVDIQKQGVPNDYARYVGPTTEYAVIWLSIALAGLKEQHTDPGLYEEHCGIINRNLIIRKNNLPSVSFS